MQKKLHFIIYLLILGSETSIQASGNSTNCCYFVCGAITGASILLLASDNEQKNIKPSKRSEWLEKTLNKTSQENQQLQNEVATLNFNLKHRDKQLAKLRAEKETKTVRFQLPNDESKKDR